ncbi:MAG: glycosyltransferase family 4 protein [Pyrinomonadaceae bacterium]
MIIEAYSGPAFILADAATFLAKIFNIPSILVLHGGNLPEFTERYPGWVRRVLGRARILVAPSNFLAEKLSVFGIRSRIIPNVIDLSKYEYRTRVEVSPKLLWMRAFHEIYNPRMAIEVFDSLRKKYPDASLVMAGVDKGLEAEIKKMAADLGLSEAIRFPGFLDHQAKIREFSHADIFLNTNHIDNMPVAVLEACAMGLPVVVTSVGGIPYLLQNGRTGLLVPDDDVEAMVGAIASLLENSDLARDLSVNGRELADRSSWENVRPQWEELFDEIQLETKSRSLDLPIRGVTIE